MSQDSFILFLDVCTQGAFSLLIPCYFNRSWSSFWYFITGSMEDFWKDVKVGGRDYSQLH